MDNNWLNRTTKQLILNTSPSDMKLRFPSETFIDGSGAPASNANWIYDPDLSSVDGWASRYWEITGDVVSLMDETARDAVDAQILSDARDMLIEQQIDNVENVVRALMLAVLDEFNLHADKINAILDAIDTATTLAEVKSLISAIPDYPQRTTAQLRNEIKDKLGS